MISHTDNYVEYCRQTARELRDPHDLALRGRGKHQMTRLVHERIVREVQLAPGDEPCGYRLRRRHASPDGPFPGHK